MGATAALLALAAAVSATGAASPSFVAGATPAAVPCVAGATLAAAPEEGKADSGEAAPASQLAARLRGANDFAMPPEMIEKLSPEQILSVLREREHGLRPGGGILLPMSFFGTLATMVLLAQIYATRRERIRHQTLRAMVEKGMDIPPELIVERTGPSADRRRGLVLVGAGLGLSLAFSVVHPGGQSGSGLWSIGLIPTLMGAGYLVAWRIGSKKALD